MIESIVTIIVNTFELFIIERSLSLNTLNFDEDLKLGIFFELYFSSISMNDLIHTIQIFLFLFFKCWFSFEYWIRYIKHNTKYTKL